MPKKVITQPLNDAQRQLVELNHNLIYKFINDNKLDCDEYYGLMAIGMCNAARTYTTSRSSFSTYAYNCMTNLLNNHYKSNKRMKRIPSSNIVSYNAEMHSKDDNLYFLDILESNIDVENEVILNLELQKYLSTLSERDISILKLYYSGFKMHEVAESLGVTRGIVDTVIVKTRKKLKYLLAR